jgi:hypothetical protein
MSKRLGVNPTAVSYNASFVKIYNATGSLERFENKYVLFYFEKKLRSRGIGSRLIPPKAEEVSDFGRRD